jgi:hypothetical protein
MEDSLLTLLISSRSVNKHDCHRQFLFLVGWFLKIFSSETLGQIKQHFAGSIYGRSSIRLPHLVPIRQKTWSLWEILVFDWLKFKKSSPETRRHNELLLCRNDVWKILYKISIFRANPTTNLVTEGSSCYTPRKHSLGGGVYRYMPVCLDQLPHLLSDFHQTLWNLRSWCVNFAV